MSDICALCLFSTGTKKDPHIAEDDNTETLTLFVVTNSEETYLEDVDDKKREMLKLVFPIMNLYLGCDLKLCNDCSKKLLAFYEFRSACLEHIRFSENANSIGEERCLLCRSSLETVKRVDNRDETHIKMMLRKCLPELVIEDTSELCRKCVYNLQDSYNFVIKCIETEDCIKNYSIMKGLTSQNKINLSDVLEFSCKKEEKSIDNKLGNSLLYELLSEQESVHKTYTDLKKEQKHSILCGEIDLTMNNEIDLTTNDEIDLKMEIEPECQIDLTVDGMQEDNKHYPFKAHNTMEAVTFYKEEIHENTIVNDPSENEAPQQIVKCGQCDYQTTRRDHLKRHVYVHREKDIKCDDCDFKTNLMDRLKKHQLKHKDPLEVRMHKCSICFFETRDKYTLRMHENVHKDQSTLQKHKCPQCSFESIHKRNLGKHIHFVHELSESKLYQCEICDFKTNYRGRIEMHKNTHTSEKRLRCKLCTFSTRLEKQLQNHLKKKHPDQTKILFTCDICQFTTDYKATLESHLLQHGDPSEVKMFKCSVCPYESLRKATLETHVRVKHSDFSFKCDVCPFKTKYRHPFAEHLLRHKEPSELATYKCEKCSYETKLKRYLLQHKKIHQDPATSKYLMCDICSYTTKRQNYLRDHMATHHKELDKCKGKLFKTYQRFGVIKKVEEA